MKRLQIQCLFLALLLPIAMGSATAESSNTPAQLREQAVQGWHQTYEAYGRTVTVDIPIQVPDTDQYPVLEAAYMPQLDRPLMSDWADPTLFQDHPGFFRLDSHSPRNMQKAGKANQKDPPYGMDVAPIYRGINQLDLNTPYAYNNPATVRDAQAMLESVWADNYPDYPITLLPCAVYATGKMRSFNKDTDMFSGDPWPYQGVLMAYFQQTVGNIPILTSADNCFRDFNDFPKHIGAAATGATGILQKTPDEQAMYHSAQYNLFSIQKTLAADFSLCGLDRIIQAYEQLIRQGLLRQISSLELGYVVWQTESNTFTLVPTWALTGYLYPDADIPTRPIPRNWDPRTCEYGTILVNAQTAALIDPSHADIQNLY